MYRYGLHDHCASYCGKHVTYAVPFTPHKSLVSYKYCYCPRFTDEETDLQRLIICSDTQVVSKEVGLKPQVGMTQKPTWFMTTLRTVCLFSVRLLSCYTVLQLRPLKEGHFFLGVGSLFCRGHHGVSHQGRDRVSEGEKVV